MRVALADVATIHAGGRLGLSGKDFVEGGSVPAYGAAGLNGYVDTAEYEGTDAVILSSIGARCGKCFLAAGTWTTLANTQVIVPDLSKVDPRFLWYQLNDESRWHRSGSAQPFIKPSDVKVHKVFLAPLPEQRRIAAILDHADALRAKRRQLLAHLDTLTQSIFHDMFGDGDYPSQRLDQLVDPEDRMNYGVVQPGDDNPHGVPLIRVSDLIGGVVDRTNLKRIAPEVEASYARSRIRGNEILVSSVGSIGAVSLVSPNDVGSNIARAVTRVPISDEVLRPYVAAYLRTPTPQRYFIAEVRTVAQPTLNVGQLAATQVPVPPIDLQLAFGHRLRAVQGIAPTVLRLCDSDDELFASLQARAFRGEL